MKHKSILLVLICLYCSIDLQAQQVSVQLSFPVGVSVRPPGPPPFGGAIWIGPEWRWKRGNYVCVPGYWAQPRHRHKHWKSGYWKPTRRGYVWVSGRWG